MRTHVIITLLAALAVRAVAGIGTVAVTMDGSVVTRAGKAVEVRAVSTVASGTAAVKYVREIWEQADEVVSTQRTNFTWTAVCEGGAVTNTTSFYPKDWLYWAGTNYVSFVTNTVVTTLSVTNRVPRLALAVTNDVASVTCSGGAGKASPASTLYLLPGDRVFYTGTARGRVDIVTEQ